MKKYRLKRRDFLKELGLGTSLLAWGCAAQAETADSLSSEARKKAARRKRRIIMNNDGNDLYSLKPEEPRTVENFLSKRTSPLLGSQVDSIFYCTGVFNVYHHKSKETELRTEHHATELYDGELKDPSKDSLTTMTDFCHKNQLEIFWSMRMNDTHDSGKKATLCKWKQDHPEYLVGKKSKIPKYLYGCNRWSSINYELQEVRDKVFRILEDVCTRYDVDGIELDFFRHPVLFKNQMHGEPITQEQCDLVTGLMKRIRIMTEKAAAKRKRPMLIAIRVPDSVGYCKALGLDLHQWLSGDLVDIVTGSGYFKLEPWGNLVKLGKKYDVPVYACMVSRRIMNGGQPEANTATKLWRGEAYNAWKAGVDGIYTFNRFNPSDPIFREIGDPKLLEHLDREDQESFVADIWSTPEAWLKNGRDFLKY